MVQVHVSNVKDTAVATFCESYESAHSMQDLTANIAGVCSVARFFFALRGGYVCISGVISLTKPCVI